ncbi:hypothetical protein PC9H_000049 [Pleurotus ostreatus]|uniref:Uncharacterized protein n=1 Tax=Pleurotus ostreatus TaxID=5322 RepID=A0A8H7A156_PLEOS|nr:uncharacterized protein PC9H_000049 [Pleurotus ostreatus]KAF7439713.1 hypothetical protein PC9H_000049 [Pleurotus ostreatus]
MPYVEETGINWSPGPTVSFHELTWDGEMGEELFVAKKCSKAFRWKPRQPKELALKREIVIKYVKDGYERNDLVVPYSLIEEMAERAEYNVNEEAHIKIKHTFSFGAATCWFKVERRRRYSHAGLRLNFVLEFANSEDCLSFIQHDLTKTKYKLPYCLFRSHANSELREMGYDTFLRTQDDEFSILKTVWQTLTPLASNCLNAQRVAIQRRLPKSQFEDEYPEPEAQLIRQRQQTSTQHNRPCYLILHLAVSFAAFNDTIGVDVATWSAINDPLAFIPPSNIFSSLKHFHVKIPLPTPPNYNYNSSLSGERLPKELALAISERGISFSTDSKPPANNVVLRIGGRYNGDDLRDISPSVLNDSEDLPLNENPQQELASVPANSARIQYTVVGTKRPKPNDSK